MCRVQSDFQETIGLRANGILATRARPCAGSAPKAELRLTLAAPGLIQVSREIRFFITIYRHLLGIDDETSGEGSTPHPTRSLTKDFGPPGALLNPSLTPGSAQHQWSERWRGCELHRETQCSEHPVEYDFSKIGAGSIVPKETEHHVTRSP